MEHHPKWKSKDVPLLHAMQWLDDCFRPVSEKDIRGAEWDCQLPPEGALDSRIQPHETGRTLEDHELEESNAGAANNFGAPHYSDSPAWSRDNRVERV